MHGTSLQKEADAVSGRGAACGEKVSRSLSEDGSACVCYRQLALTVCLEELQSFTPWRHSEQGRERERAKCEWE